MTGQWIHTLIDLPPLFDVLLKVSIVLALGWGLHFVLLDCNPRWRTLLWRTVAVGILAVPLIVLVLPAVKVPVASTPVAATGALEVIGPAPLPVLPPVATPQPTGFEAARLNPGAGALLVWTLVTLLLAIRVVRASWRVQRMVKSSSAVPEDTGMIMRRVAAALQCPHQVTLRQSKEMSSPFLCGLRRPLIVLPERLTQADYAAELPAIFAHELVHLRTHDLWWMGVVQWLETLLWFHPLAWRMRVAHAAACEEICDAVAADYVGDGLSYSRTLSRVALERVAIPPVIGGIPMARVSAIRHRLELLKKKVNSSRLPLRWAILAILVGSLGLAGVASLRVVYAEESDSSAPESVQQLNTIIPHIRVSNIDIREFLILVSKHTGLNFTVSKEVKGPVTVELSSISVRDTLDLVLKDNGWDYIVTPNGIVRVITQEQYDKEASRQNSASISDGLEDVQLEGLDRLIPGGLSVAHIDVREVLTLLEKYSGLRFTTTPSVEGPVTFVLRNVSVRQVLNLLAKQQGLRYGVTSNGVVQVMSQREHPETVPPSRFLAREYPAENISLEELDALLRPLLSEEGSLVVDEERRKITVFDNSEATEKMDRAYDYTQPRALTLRLPLDVAEDDLRALRDQLEREGVKHEFRIFDNYQALAIIGKGDVRDRVSERVSQIVKESVESQVNDWVSSSNPTPPTPAAQRVGSRFWNVKMIIGKTVSFVDDTGTMVHKEEGDEHRGILIKEVNAEEGYILAESLEDHLGQRRIIRIITRERPEHPGERTDREKEATPKQQSSIEARLNRNVPLLDVKDTDIQEVLSILGRISGLNIVPEKDVEGTVTMNVRNKTVREALDLLLPPNGYGYIIHGESILVKKALISRHYKLEPESAENTFRLIELELYGKQGRPSPSAEDPRLLVLEPDTHIMIIRESAERVKQAENVLNNQSLLERVQKTGEEEPEISQGQEEWTVQLVPVHYADLEKLLTQLNRITGQKGVDQGVKLYPHPESQSIIIQANKAEQAELEVVKDLIAQLDVPTPAVEFVVAIGQVSAAEIPRQDMKDASGLMTIVSDEEHDLLLDRLQRHGQGLTVSSMKTFSGKTASLSLAPDHHSGYSLSVTPTALNDGNLILDFEFAVTAEETSSSAQIDQPVVSGRSFSGRVKIKEPDALLLNVPSGKNSEGEQRSTLLLLKTKPVVQSEP